MYHFSTGSSALPLLNASHLIHILEHLTHTTRHLVTSLLALLTPSHPLAILPAAILISYIVPNHHTNESNLIATLTWHIHPLLSQVKMPPQSRQEQPPERRSFLKKSRSMPHLESQTLYQTHHSQPLPTSQPFPTFDPQAPRLPRYHSDRSPRRRNSAIRLAKEAHQRLEQKRSRGRLRSRSSPDRQPLPDRSTSPGVLLWKKRGSLRRRLSERLLGTGGPDEAKQRGLSRAWRRLLGLSKKRKT